jgi:hypothetical protein
MSFNNIIDEVISLAVRPEFSDALAKDILKTIVDAYISGSGYNERFSLESQLSKIMQEPPNQDIQNILLTHAMLQYRLAATEQNRQDIAQGLVSLARTNTLGSQRDFNSEQWMTDDIIAKTSGTDALFLRTYRDFATLRPRLNRPDGYAYFSSALADKQSETAIIAQVVTDDTNAGMAKEETFWFLTQSGTFVSSLLSSLPSDVAAFWTAYQTTPTIRWRLLEPDGFTYFQQVLIGKPSDAMIAKIVEDETSGQHLSIIVSSGLIDAVSDNVLNLLPPDQKTFWSSIVDYLHTGASNTDILKLTDRIEKNPAIRAALLYIPPEQRV